MNVPFYKPLPTKTRVYESLYALNRGFEITLLSFEQLERLGMFRGEHLNGFKVSLERTRAEANEELIETLHNYEVEQSSHFEQLERDWQDRLRDPDDVFLAARDRKAEIKDQIKNLQAGLDLVKRKHKKQSSRRTTKKR